MNSVLITAEFWQAVSFVLFLILVYRPVKKLILGSLDKRAAKIKNDVEEMNKLIDEVGLSLEQIKAKYDTIDQELELIARNTEREIDLLKKTFEKEITQYISQKTKQLVEKISADERKALEKLRVESVNSAIIVAGNYIEQMMDKTLIEEQLQLAMKSIQDKIRV